MLNVSGTDILGTVAEEKSGAVACAVVGNYAAISAATIVSAWTCALSSLHLHVILLSLNSKTKEMSILAETKGTNSFQAV